MDDLTEEKNSPSPNSDRLPNQSILNVPDRGSGDVIRKRKSVQFTKSMDPALLDSDIIQKQPIIFENKD